MAYQASNPYYDPYSTYGSQFGSGFPTTPIGQQYLQDNPQAAYTRHTSTFAGGNTPYDQFVQSQYQKVLQGFNAALGTNPNLRFTDHMSGFGPQQFQQQFRSLDPSQRGERWNVAAPRARWMSRG